MAKRLHRAGYVSDRVSGGGGKATVRATSDANSNTVDVIGDRTPVTMGDIRAIKCALTPVERYVLTHAQRLHYGRMDVGGYYLPTRVLNQVLMQIDFNDLVSRGLAPAFAEAWPWAFESLADGVESEM